MGRLAWNGGILRELVGSRMYCHCAEMVLLRRGKQSREVPVVLEKNWVSSGGGEGEMNQWRTYNEQGCLGRGCTEVSILLQTS